MEKRPERRLRIWDVADDQPGMEKPGVAQSGHADGREGPGQASPYVRQGRRSQTAAAFASSYDVWVPLDLQVVGTCDLPEMDRLECKSKSISPAAATFTYDPGKANASARPIERDITGLKAQFHLEQIGSVDGLVTSHDAAEFSVAIDETHREPLRRRLSRIAKDADIPFNDTPTKLSVKRIEPETKNCIFSDGAGTKRKGKIVNLSPIDILIRTAIIPARDSKIIFSGRPHRLAKVIRSFETGFAASFYVPISGYDSPPR